MLDVRALAYVLPLNEQPQASILPTVTVENFADEDATLTGTFRIYRESTGLLEYVSAAMPTALPHGATSAVAAQTPFSPGAIVNNDYFVNFDGVAKSTSTGQLITFVLGSFHFDIKAGPMGPAPAAHGSTHADGSSDELEVEDLGTAELDDTLVLSPTGAGGVEWKASPAGVTDHGLLTGLGDNDHPQYLLATRFFRETDCLFSLAGSYTAPWSIVLIGAGTVTGTPGEANHPGILNMNGVAAAGTGAALRVGTNAFLLAGDERCDFILRPLTLAGTTIRAGFLDSISATAPNDGAYLFMDPVTALLTGRTFNNTVGSVTGTSYQLLTNTWYRFRVIVDPTAARVDFYCYDMAGALLWTDNLTTNIPTAAGREVGCGVLATTAGGGAVSMLDVDYTSIEITRTLTR